MSKQQYADDDFEIIKGVRVLKDKRRSPWAWP